MDERLTHASFFSGVGGLDMGLERAGWRTVSFSEIDPYASAVLAERWPGVPNLGDIAALAGQLRVDERAGGQPPSGPRGDIGEVTASGGIPAATLWTGGFPCQDLSVAGKRRGMGAGTRSGLAFAFLDLAAVHRPRFILLENVPGLLSSHGGRDMAALLGALVELGYGVGYRILDARYFGVPQRRRRVFILGVSLGGRAGAERAAEVLSVGSRCDRHPPTGVEAGPGAAWGANDRIAPALTLGPPGPGHNGRDEQITIGTIREHVRPGSNTDHTIVERASPDSRGMRAPDGLAGGSHDRNGVELQQGGEQSYHQRDRIYGHTAPALDAYGDTPSDAPLIAYRKATKAHGSDDWERWERVDMSDTLDAEGMSRAASAILGSATGDDPLLPLGLDSHRYRCCGNGVVSDVAEWIGRRLAAIV